MATCDKCGCELECPVCNDAADKNRRLRSALREKLGRRVREVWIAWAGRQPSPKPSWLVPYDDLPEADKEADRCIGAALWADFVAENIEEKAEVVRLRSIEKSQHESIVEKDIAIRQQQVEIDRLTRQVKELENDILANTDYGPGHSD